jgi:hypothetical protein
MSCARINLSHGTSKVNSIIVTNIYRLMREYFVNLLKLKNFALTSPALNWWKSEEEKLELAPLMKSTVQEIIYQEWSSRLDNKFS